MAVPRISPTIDLAFADRAQLTLLLSRHVQNPHVESALARNTQRVAKVAAEYAEIAPLFDHVVLKGFTHVPEFIGDLRLRVQYDLDLYVPPSETEKARDASGQAWLSPHPRHGIAGHGSPARDGSQDRLGVAR